MKRCRVSDIKGAAMKRTFLGFLRTTLVGGITFLLPIVLIAWLFQKAMGLAGILAKPALALLPDSLAGGVVIGAIETSAALLILAFAAGLMARTNLGQRFMAWVENSLIGSLPQFSFVRGIADSVDDSDDNHVEVVLVPADAGWALGFIFEPSDAAFVPVFLPGAPQWTSGSVVFAERANIRPAGIGFPGAIKIMKKLGVGSDKVVAALAHN
jgi:uncharacterized membrane protein